MTSTGCQAQTNIFQRALLDVASGLHQQDIQNISFLQKDKVNKQCTCRGQGGAEGVSCPHHGGLNGVALIEQLLEKGVFSKTNTDPLMEMLKEIGRHDLADRFEESYLQKYCMCDPSVGVDQGIYYGDEPRPKSRVFVPLPLSPHHQPVLFTQSPAGHSNQHRVEPDIEVDKVASRSPVLSPAVMSTPTVCDPVLTPTLYSAVLQSSVLSTPTVCDPVSTPTLCSPVLQPSVLSTPTVRDLPLSDCRAAFNSQKSLGFSVDSNDSGYKDGSSPDLPTDTDSAAPCSEGQSADEAGKEYPSELFRSTTPDNIVTQSLPATISMISPSSTRSNSVSVSFQDEYHYESVDPFEVISSETETGASPSGEEFEIIVNRDELQEMQQAFEQFQPTRNRKSLIDKLRNPKPTQKNKPEEIGIDEFEIIEKEDWPINVPCQNHRSPRLSSRTFSLDSLKKKQTKHLSPLDLHRMSVPEVTQSCGDFRQPSSTSPCGGACAHTPEVRKKPWQSGSFRDSQDSGMDSTSEESIAISDSGRRSTSPAPLGHGDSARKTSNDKDGTKLVEWKITRDSMLQPIYNHKDSFHSKKVNISVGRCGKSRLGINLLVKLYPNGLDFDVGTYSTLKVDIIGMSHQPSPTSYLNCTFRGRDTQNYNLIASRNIKHPLASKSFTLTEFLSHDVIKVSSAKRFEFLLTFQIQVLVNNEWVVASDTETFVGSI